MGIPKQIQEFRARTSDSKMYPVDSLKVIVLDIRNEIERHDVLDMLEARLDNTQFVNLSKKEVDSLVTLALEDWGADYGG